MAVVSGLLSLALALVGQSWLAPLPPTSSPNVGMAAVWYGLAVAVLLVGWWGSYTNLSLVRPAERDKRARAAPDEQRRGMRALFGARLGLGALGFIVTIVSTGILRSDWSSLGGLLLWIAGLGLMAGACIGERRAPASGSASLAGDEKAGEALAGRLPRHVEIWLFAAIMLLAVTMRLWRLGDVTAGMHGDEGEAGTDALSILHGQIVSPFTRGWFNQSNMYYWSIAVGLKLFGSGLFGLRAFSTACGLITVLCVYAIARAMFGQRAAIIAGFFIAFQSGALIFSREEFSNSTMPAFLAGAFYCVVRGLRTKRRLDFILAGFVAGFGLYYFAGGRLIAPTVGALLVYLAVVHRPFLAAYWQHCVVFVTALIAVSAPFLVYYVDNPITSDVYPNDRFIWQHYGDLAAEYNVTGWPGILWNQLTHTLSVITHVPDQSALYALSYPMDRPLEAALIVLGLAWALWRWRDTRFALMSLWFWASIIGGGVLTFGQPNLPRILGILPVLPLAIASVLDHFASQLAIAPRMRPVLGRARHRLGGARLGGACVAAAIVVCGVQNWHMYIDYYLNSHPFAETVEQAAFVQSKGPSYRFYNLGVPYIYWGYGVNRFINNTADGTDVVNPATILPIVDNGPHGDKNVAFLVWGVMFNYLPLLHAYYPEGTQQTIPLYDYRHPTSPLVTFTLSHQQIDARRVSRVRYNPAYGASLERMEPRLGLTDNASLPAGLRYPVRIAWDGGLVAPSAGIYRFKLAAPATTRFTIDGVNPFTRSQPAGAVVTASLVLAQGRHTVHLATSLAGPGTPVRLLWAVGAGGWAPIPRRYLWDNHN